MGIKRQYEVQGDGTVLIVNTEKQRIKIYDRQQYYMYNADEGENK